MIEEEYISRIKLATELSTKKIISMHRKNKDGSDDEDTIYEYESLFRSMIYHELMMLGIYFGDVTMDNAIISKEEGLIHKKPDIWIENTESGDSYVLEIKMIRARTKNQMVKRVNANGPNSIIEDINKLSRAMIDKSLKIKGIIVLSHQSPIFDEEEDPLDVLDNEIRKIVNIIKPPHNLIFMLCNENFCRVFHARDILKK